MRIAVALQTADRPDYTAKTLQTFALHNDLSRFVLLHGDDASATSQNLDLAAQYGFQTVVRARKARGGLSMRTALIEHGAARADWVLVLENDMQTLRPFPWPLFEHVANLPWAYSLRLFGAFKGPNQTDPCKTVNQWAPDKPVAWKALRGAPEPAEFGIIHWSAQPTVTRSAPLLALHKYGVKELRQKTVRVRNNVFVHVGDVRTKDLPSRKAVAA